MDLLRQAAHQALEALEGFVYHGIGPNSGPALASLRAALAQPEQEPVAWLRQRDSHLALNDGGLFGDEWTPLYTSLQPDTEMPKTLCGPNLEEVLNAAGFFKRKPLTDEALMALLPGAVRLPLGWKDFARAIEKAHGIGGRNE